MKPITKIQTFDGILHDSQREAEKHLDKLEANILTQISCDIANRFKIAYDNASGYTGIMCELTKARIDTGTYILDNFDKFLQLQKIQADRKMTDND